MMQRIAVAQERAVAGDRQGARDAFAAVRADLGEDGDGLHVVSLAHYAADVKEFLGGIARLRTELGPA